MVTFVVVFSPPSRSARKQKREKVAYQKAKAALQQAEAACASGSAAEVERIERATAAFEAAGGYSIDARVARVLKVSRPFGQHPKICRCFLN